MDSNKRQWRIGFRDGIPIGLGYLAVSFTFGIMAKNSGLTVFQAVLMSAVNLTSAGQFAALSLIAGAASYFEMALTQLVINIRYCLMSCSLSQKIDGRFPFYHRFFIAFGISDEIFGVSACKEGRLSPFYSYGVMSAAVPGWVLGTLLGIVSGSILPQRLLSALGVALYGMFLAVIIPPARKERVIAGLVGLSMAMSFLFDKAPFLAGISSGFKIILLTLLLAGGAAVLFPLKEGEGDEGE